MTGTYEIGERLLLLVRAFAGVPALCKRVLQSAKWYVSVIRLHTHSTLYAVPAVLPEQALEPLKHGTKGVLALPARPLAVPIFVDALPQMIVLDQLVIELGLH